MTLSVAAFRAIIEDLQFQDWKFLIDDMGEGFSLQVQFEAANPETGALEVQKGRKWYISRHMTRGEVIQTAFLAIKTAQEHELREQFTYQGQAIFGPHFNVDALVAACEQKQFETRAPLDASVPAPMQAPIPEVSDSK